MDSLRLREMTAVEFDGLRSRLADGFAARQVATGEWAADGAVDHAIRRVNELLPEGVGTPGMLVLTAENSGGEAVGYVWVALRHAAFPAGDAWICYIEVRPELRGRGYGRALLRAAERETARHGATAMGLNVFGQDAAARALYASCGYEIASMHLRKTLDLSD